MGKEVRYKLLIGKFRVIKREKHYFVVELPNNMTMTVDMHIPADVRLGDVLTFYTEVLAHANVGSASKQ